MPNPPLTAPSFEGNSAREHEVLRVRSTTSMLQRDMLAEEVPVALVYNGISHAVMMATPGDLEDFALGFSLSEGILAHAGECYGIEVQSGPAGVEVALDVASRAFMELKDRRRTLAGRTGCGLCGVDSLDQVQRPARSLAPAQGFNAAGMRRALSALSDAQALAKITGATHAAAWCSMAGELLIVREDVGRHNALDKVIGAMARGKAAPADGFLLITSRVSFEMAQKSIVMGVPALVGVSAPTAAAVALAEASGMTLVAFARGENFSVYTHTQHLQL